MLLSSVGAISLICTLVPVTAQNFVLGNMIWNGIIKYDQNAEVACMFKARLEVPRLSLECADLHCLSTLLVQYAPGCAQFQDQICRGGARHAIQNGVEDCSRICSQLLPTQLAEVPPSHNATNQASQEASAFVHTMGHLFALTPGSGPASVDAAEWLVDCSDARASVSSLKTLTGPETASICIVAGALVAVLLHGNHGGGPNCLSRCLLVQTSECEKDG